MDWLYHVAIPGESVASRALTFLNVIEAMDGPIEPGAPVLDFGCGAGDMVRDLCTMGFDAFGCDLAFKKGPALDGLKRAGRVKLIDPHPYTLPFDDGVFAIVVSDQVFEHVLDLDSALREMERVLQPGGVTLHIFPSRYTPIEPHTLIPGATLCRRHSWLRLWAQLDIRDGLRDGEAAAVAARRNRDYLLACTNYLTKRQIRCAFACHFPGVQFCEREFLDYGEGAWLLRRALAAVPGFPELYSTMRGRVLFSRKAPLSSELPSLTQRRAGLLSGLSRPRP
jgi:SAM-dependent methyltransferase